MADRPRPKFVQISASGTKYTSRVYALDAEGNVWLYAEWYYKDRPLNDRSHEHWEPLDKFAPPSPRPLTPEEQGAKEVEELCKR